MAGRSLRQAKLSRAIQLFLRVEQLEHLWSDNGPTSDALYARRALGRPLSGNARLLLLAVFDVWDRKGGANFGELVDRLTIDHLNRLFALALAAKAHDDGAIDAWLARYGG
jgi:hypothetical protein